MNNIDPPLIAVSVPRKTVFASKEELFRYGFTRYFVSRFAAFPVRPGKIDMAGGRQVKELLNTNWALVVFPEGMRSQRGGMLPAFPGSASIAVRYNVPILPLGIIGTERLVGKTWFFKRPKITVNIGKPFSLPSNGKVSGEEIKELSNTIMCRIAELLPEKYHGCYTGRVVNNANRKVS
jgi:1-acyl-sn-glycerol-3-phosphate acyltransferase